jgi:asparaginyl-tRNA synthetase
MLEAEIAFVDTLDGLLDAVEDGIRCTLAELLLGEHGRAQRSRQDLAVLSDSQAHLHDVLKSSFQRLSYTEVISILQEEHAESPFERAPVWGESLASEHEKWLAGVHVDGPVFVTDYPRDLKPFYMLPSAEQPSQGPTVACFDLLVPEIGELAGGSLREYRLAELEQSITSAGLDKAAYQWYLDLRQFGSVPHGGWGMGWERWVCWVTGTANVRDAVAFPRWVGNCRY